MDYLRPKKLSFDFIRNKAEEFREQFVKPPDLIPVPIIEIVEFDLNITPIPIPNMLRSIDVDGFLANDLTNLYIDNDIYSDERYLNRLRFTYAHEIGHLVLHKEEIEQCNFRTEEDWLHFREEMLEDDLFHFEQQAYEFAGRLLVPPNKLKQELINISDKIEQFRAVYNFNDNELLTEAISRVICSKFGVSDKVICRRLKKENIKY